MREDEEVAEEVLGGREIPEVVELVRERGGATLDSHTGREPARGYVVNEAGGCPSLARNEFYGPSAREVVRDLLWENKEWYQGKHVGIWDDEENGRVTFDRVDVIEDRCEATRLGEERGERSIWDVEQEEEITLSAGRE